MTLSDLANLGTLASAVAVLASLLYLNTQVRQAEKNQRALLNQAVATRGVGILQWGTEQHVAELRARVMTADRTFTATEITQLMFLLRATIAVNQDTHLQHSVGLIDTRTFKMTLGALRAHLAWPVFRAIWTMIRMEFPPETMAFVDDVMTQTPVAAPRDLSADLRNALTALDRA
jgi:hypothetical protein